MTAARNVVRWPLGCRFIDYTGRKFTVRKIVFGDAIEGCCNTIVIDEGVILQNRMGEPQTHVGFVQDGSAESEIIIQPIDVIEELFRSKNISYLPYGA